MSEIVLVNGVAAVELFEKGGVDDFIEKVRQEATAEVHDVSTPAGRKAIASQAYKVSTTKTTVDKAGKELVAGMKEKTKKIDAERKKVRDSLDELRDEIRKPLNDWEEAEEARREELAQRMENLRAYSEVEGMSSEEIEKNIDAVELIDTDGAEWGERFAEAGMLRDSVLKNLRADFIIRTDEEKKAAAAEAERIAAEEKERQEREDRIAAEAAEAARKEAEEKAAAEAAEKEKERLRLENEKLEAEKAAEEAKKEAAEAERAAAEAEEQRAREAAEAAERERIAAEESAERERKAAEEAAAQERARQEAEAAEKAAAEKARAANVEHRRHVNNVILGTLVEGSGITEDQGKKILGMIVKGEVSNIQIKY